MGSQRVRHDWWINTFTFKIFQISFGKRHLVSRSDLAFVSFDWYDRCPDCQLFDSLWFSPEEIAQNWRHLWFHLCRKGTVQSKLQDLLPFFVPSPPNKVFYRHHDGTGGRRGGGWTRQAQKPAAIAYLFDYRESNKCDVSGTKNIWNIFGLIRTPKWVQS